MLHKLDCTFFFVFLVSYRSVFTVHSYCSPRTSFDPNFTIIRTWLFCCDICFSTFALFLPFLFLVIRPHLSFHFECLSNVNVFENKRNAFIAHIELDTIKNYCIIPIFKKKTNVHSVGSWHKSLQYAFSWNNNNKKLWINHMIHTVRWIIYCWHCAR